MAGFDLILLVGDFDISAAMIQHCLRESRAPHVFIDLSSLICLDAAGISALVNAKRQLSREGRFLTVIGAGGIQQVLLVADTPRSFDN